MFSTVPSFNRENQKSALEHFGLFLCLVVFTGAGAKVKTRFYISIFFAFFSVGYYVLHIDLLFNTIRYCGIIESTSTRDLKRSTYA